MAYGDYVGELTADFPGFSSEITKFAEDVGINTKELTIIGFDLNAGENDPERSDHPSINVYLLAVLHKVWKEKYKNFGEYWNNEGKLQVVRYETKMNLQDFFKKYLKRFEGTMIWPFLSNHELQIESNEDDSDSPT